MEKRKALILIGGEWHNFEACGEILKGFLKQTGWIVPIVTTDREILASPKMKDSDLCIFYTQGGTLTPPQLDGLLSFVRSGKGFVGIHCAADSFTENKEYIDMLGGMFVEHPPVHEFRVEVTDPDHMLGRRIEPFRITDELYILKYDPTNLHTVLHTYWKGKKEPMGYTKPYGKGTVCYIGLGHDAKAFNHPVFQRLVIRGVGLVTGQKEGKTVRCGVIGYGGTFDMGKGHGEWINATPGLKMIAACDIDPSRMDAAKKDFPGIETYTDPDVMLETTKADLIVIVTPHNTHFALARAALRAGKHVLLEKPMCLKAKEATTLINIAKRQGVALSVFHNRRWDGAYLTIREIVDAGLIGDVFHVEAFYGNYGYPGDWWRSDKAISGGAMYDWGAHYVDWILNMIKHPIVNVTGFFHKRVWHGVTNEDQCHAVIRFEGGRVADLQISHIACAGKPKWRILGERGAIVYHHDADELELSGHVHGGDIRSRVKIKKSVWALPYYRDLANHLLLGEPLEVTAEQARRTIAVLEAAEKSSEEGVAVVPAYT
jgi:predicted dehydrogenase/type 1 glutamine amidotransferase